ncbi:hypothetical protein PR048_024294 [Dryococelus australis]|uniref:Uncharacterized protein n=1 Tax=Dryococelus australis TaxID=614101 RepID=A0ABQ9GN67_9NEOP|nr:hypothetical protein PR048_024294 [Dryococelus australis]
MQTTASHPAKLVRLQAGSHMGIVALVGGFSQRSPVPHPLHSGAAPYSPRFTFIGYQDFDVKSRSNLFTLRGEVQLEKVRAGDFESSFYFFNPGRCCDGTKLVLPHSVLRAQFCFVLGTGKEERKTKFRRKRGCSVKSKLIQRSLADKGCFTSGHDALNTFNSAVARRLFTTDWKFIYYVAAAEESWKFTRSKWAEKWEIPEKTHPPAASSGTILTCQNPVARSEIEPGSPCLSPLLIRAYYSLEGTAIEEQKKPFLILRLKYRESREQDEKDKPSMRSRREARRLERETGASELRLRGGKKFPVSSQELTKARGQNPQIHWSPQKPDVKGLFYLELEAQKRVSNKGDIATCIKCANAATCESLYQGAIQFAFVVSLCLGTLRYSVCLLPSFQSSDGAAVAERLACSPPTKANRVQSPAVSPDFRMWKSCRTMPSVSGFSRGSPVSSALSFRRCSILTSITLTGSQNIVVKSRPNLFTHSSIQTSDTHASSSVASPATLTLHCKDDRSDRLPARLALTLAQSSNYKTVGSEDRRGLSNLVGTIQNVYRTPNPKLNPLSHGGLISHTRWLAFVNRHPLLASPLSSWPTPSLARADGSRETIQSSNMQHYDISEVGVASPNSVDENAVRDYKLKCCNCELRREWHREMPHASQKNSSGLQTGYPRENLLTSGVVRHDSNMRPAENRTQTGKLGRSRSLRRVPPEGSFSTHRGLWLVGSEGTRANGCVITQRDLLAAPSRRGNVYGETLRWSHGHKSLPTRQQGSRVCYTDSNWHVAGFSVLATYLSAGFLGDLPFLRPMNSGAAACSSQLTLIGSQDIVVKSHIDVSIPRTTKRFCVSSTTLGYRSLNATLLLRRDSPESGHWLLNVPVGALQRPHHCPRAISFSCAGNMNMKRHRYEEAGVTGDPRENPPTNGIVRHDSHLRKSGSPWREASGLTAQPPWARTEQCLVSQPSRPPVAQSVDAPPVYGAGGSGLESQSERTMPLVGGFSRGSPVTKPFHSGAAQYSPQLPSSTFKTSLLRVAQISSLTHSLTHPMRLQECSEGANEERSQARSLLGNQRRLGIDVLPSEPLRHEMNIPANHDERAASETVLQGVGSTSSLLRLPVLPSTTHVQPLRHVRDAYTLRQKKKKTHACPSKVQRNMFRDWFSSEVSTEQRRSERVRETGDPRENSPTSGIVHHDSRMRKSRRDPSGNRISFA